MQVLVTPTCASKFFPHCCKQLSPNPHHPHPSGLGVSTLVVGKDLGKGIVQALEDYLGKYARILVLGLADSSP